MTYTINIDNVIDLITNSSSELFVLQGSTFDIVKEMVSNIYPDYLNEYEELQDVKEMSNSDIESFLEWHLGANDRCNAKEPQTKPEQYKLLPGCTLEELYDTSEIKWSNSYDLKRDLITNDNRDKIIKGIEESVGRYFLYSIDENPDWDMQESLMGIGTRYHLG
jgi:hypothetical protein